MTMRFLNKEKDKTQASSRPRNENVCYRLQYVPPTGMLQKQVAMQEQCLCLGAFCRHWSHTCCGGAELTVVNALYWVFSSYDHKEPVVF